MASRGVRVAAAILWRALVLIAGLHVYWLLGGTWAVHAGSGGNYSDVTTGLRIQSAVVAVLLVVGCLVVRARAGLWQAPASDRMVRIAMWVLTAALALAAATNLAASTNWERYAIGPFVLLLVVLAFVVASDGARSLPHRARPGPKEDSVCLEEPLDDDARDRGKTSCRAPHRRGQIRRAGAVEV